MAKNLHLPTELPKNWNPNFTKPHEPYTKPTPTLKKRDVLETFKLGTYSDFTPPPGTDIIRVNAECDYVYDSCEVTIIADACGPEYEVPNPEYDKEMKRWDKSMEIYKANLAQWKIYKKIYDQQALEIQDAAEKELYRKLKKKYDK